MTKTYLVTAKLPEGTEVRCDVFDLDETSFRAFTADRFSRLDTSKDHQDSMLKDFFYRVDPNKVDKYRQTK